MKKPGFILGVLAIALVLAPVAQALDPVAPRSFRKFGMLYVKTPTASDKITYIDQKSGTSKEVQPYKVEVLPIGKYDIKVQMQEYTYNQMIEISPTERTDVVVPGFGNIKVNSPLADTLVEAYKPGSGTLVAKFKANEIKTLPRGNYDIKIKVRGFTVPKDGVYIYTNTTRQLDVIPSEAKVPKET